MNTLINSEPHAPPQKPPLEHSDRARTHDRCAVWGVDFDVVTHEQTIQYIDQRIRDGRPGYVITANLQYVTLTDQKPDLRQINQQADLILADGMPIVWRSRFTQTPLPERIAGSDIIYSLAELAAEQCYRIFFLGGAEGVAAETADTLAKLYPGMTVAGVETPPFRTLSPDEDRAMAERIRDSRPDILLAALGQPYGERWIHRWLEVLDVPVCIQVGGSFNFVTNRIVRCPPWLATIGLEWTWRLACEPRRLAGRYAVNILFLMKSLLRDFFGKNNSGVTPS